MDCTNCRSKECGFPDCLSREEFEQLPSREQEKILSRLPAQSERPKLAPIPWRRSTQVALN